MRNIDYLALDDAIKRFLGKWWRRWVKTSVGKRLPMEEVDGDGVQGQGHGSGCEDEGVGLGGLGRQMGGEGDAEVVVEMMRAL